MENEIILSYSKGNMKKFFNNTLINTKTSVGEYVDFISKYKDDDINFTCSFQMKGNRRSNLNSYLEQGTTIPLQVDIDEGEKFLEFLRENNLDKYAIIQESRSSKPEAKRYHVALLVELDKSSYVEDIEHILSELHIKEKYGNDFRCTDNSRIFFSSPHSPIVKGDLTSIKASVLKEYFK